MSRVAPASLRFTNLRPMLAVTDLARTRRFYGEHHGMKEFEVRDPDGYWLWLGEPTNEPPAQQE